MNVGRLVRVYVLTLGALLLLEGGALLLLDRLPLSLAFTASDTRHNLLHVMWGAGLLAIVVTARDSDRIACQPIPQQRAGGPCCHQGRLDTD